MQGILILFLSQMSAKLDIIWTSDNLHWWRWSDWLYLWPQIIWQTLACKQVQGDCQLVNYESGTRINC